MRSVKISLMLTSGRLKGPGMRSPAFTKRGNTKTFLNVELLNDSIRFRGYQSLDCVLIDLFMGGSETTAITLLWTFLFLLHHPDVQAKIHEELDRVCQGRVPTLEDQENLHYLKVS